MMINSGLYTGLEVFGNIQGAKCTETSGGDKTKDTLSVKDSFGALVKLGYVFKSANNLLTYISLGAVNSKFKAESTGGRKNISLSKRKTGFLLGLNADIPIGKNFFIRAGLSHTWYGKVTYRLDNGTDVGHDSKAFQALAGVGYRF
jgi:opacity protein-like surface antigen